MNTPPTSLCDICANLDAQNPHCENPTCAQFTSYFVCFCEDDEYCDSCYTAELDTIKGKIIS